MNSPETGYCLFNSVSLVRGSEFCELYTVMEVLEVVFLIREHPVFRARYGYEVTECGPSHVRSCALQI